jgi:hypothetical protein
MADYKLDDYLEDLKKIQLTLNQKLKKASDSIVISDLLKILHIFDEKILELEDRYYKLGLKKK